MKWINISLAALAATLLVCLATGTPVDTRNPVVSGLMTALVVSGLCAGVIMIKRSRA